MGSINVNQKGVSRSWRLMLCSKGFLLVYVVIPMIISHSYLVRYLLEPERHICYLGLAAPSANLSICASHFSWCYI